MLWSSAFLDHVVAFADLIFWEAWWASDELLGDRTVERSGRDLLSIARAETECSVHQLGEATSGLTRDRHSWYPRKLTLELTLEVGKLEFAGFVSFVEADHDR